MSEKTQAEQAMDLRVGFVDLPCRLCKAINVETPWYIEYMDCAGYFHLHGIQAPRIWPRYPSKPEP